MTKLPPAFRMIVRFTVGATASVLAFVLGYVFLRPMLSGDPIETARARIAAVEQAAAMDSSESTSDAVAKAMRADGENYLTSAPNESRRQSRAADMYWGYYYRKIRGMPEYCSAYGVQLAGWISALASVNMPTHQVALAVYASTGTDTTSLFDRIDPLVKEQVAKELSAIADEENISIADVCRYLDQDSEELAKMSSFKEQMPAAFEVLARHASAVR